MILISFVHLTDTERNMTENIGEGVTRNTEFTGAEVTLELRQWQELHWQKFYADYLRQSKKYIWNGKQLVSYRLFNLLRIKNKH